jgi:hypothetical protein
MLLSVKSGVELDHDARRRHRRLWIWWGENWNALRPFAHPMRIASPKYPSVGIPTLNKAEKTKGDSIPERRGLDFTYIPFLVFGWAWPRRLHGGHETTHVRTKSMSAHLRASRFYRSSCNVVNKNGKVVNMPRRSSR